VFDSLTHLTKEFCRVHFVDKEAIDFIHRNNLWGLPLDFITKTEALDIITPLQSLKDLLEKEHRYIRKDGKVFLDESIEQGCDIEGNECFNIDKYVYQEDDILHLDLYIVPDVNYLSGNYTSLKTKEVTRISLDDPIVIELAKRTSSYEINPHTRNSSLLPHRFEEKTQLNEDNKVKTVTTIRHTEDVSFHDELKGCKEISIPQEIYVYPIEGEFQDLPLSKETHSSGQIKKDLPFSTREHYFYYKITNSVSGAVSIRFKKTKEFFVRVPRTNEFESLVEISEGDVIPVQYPEEAFHLFILPKERYKYVKTESIEYRNIGTIINPSTIMRATYHYDLAGNRTLKECHYHNGQEAKNRKVTTLFYESSDVSKTRQLKMLELEGNKVTFPCI
jgi:hypothetical protein